jgi:hypothetical protein
MTSAPTEEKLTSSTLQSSTLPTHVGGREREKEEEQLTTFLGNENSLIEKLFAVSPAQ